VNQFRVVIIGAGVSGLAAAMRLGELAQKNNTALELNILDEGKNPGGTVSTVVENDFLLEEGPDCFLTEKPAGMAMVKQLGLDSQLMGTNPNLSQSFILKGNRLCPIPEGFYKMAPSRLMPLMTTPLLSPLGKLRAAMEPFIPVRRDVQDESVGDFVTRRLGREVLDHLAQPLVGGVYNADPFELSLNASTPHFKDMELKHGSLLKAMAHRRMSSQKKVSGARYSLFATFPKGMQTLVDAMASKIPMESLWLQNGVQSLRTSDKGTWEISANDRSIEADAVLLAIQPSKMLPLIGHLDNEWQKLLSGIPAHDSATLNLGFRREDITHLLNGFGFVVPSIEKKLIVGCSFSSRKFEGRAPDGYVLLRVFLGAEAVSLAKKGEETLLNKVLEELTPVLGIRNRPVMNHLSLYNSSMTYYRPGHLSQVARLLQKAEETKGLYLAGNGIKGSGIPDAIAAGQTAAEKIFQTLVR